MDQKKLSTLAYEWLADSEDREFYLDLYNEAQDKGTPFSQYLKEATYYGIVHVIPGMGGWDDVDQKFASAVLSDAILDVDWEAVAKLVKAVIIDQKR